MRLQVREPHFLEMIVVLTLLNSLGKHRAYPRLLISCPSLTPTPKSHSNEYSTTHSKPLVFHASLNLWVESIGESQGSAVPLSSVVLHFCVNFCTGHAYVALHYDVCSATYTGLASYCEPAFIFILILILQWTYRDSVLSSAARLHVNPIHFLVRHAVC